MIFLEPVWLQQNPLRNSMSSLEHVSRIPLEQEFCECTNSSMRSFVVPAVIVRLIENVLPVWINMKLKQQNIKIWFFDKKCQEAWGQVLNLTVDVNYNSQGALWQGRSNHRASQEVEDKDGAAEKTKQSEALNRLSFKFCDITVLLMTEAIVTWLKLTNVAWLKLT